MQRMKDIREDKKDSEVLESVEVNWSNNST